MTPRNISEEVILVEQFDRLHERIFDRTDLSAETMHDLDQALTAASKAVGMGGIFYQTAPAWLWHETMKRPPSIGENAYLRALVVFKLTTGWYPQTDHFLMALVDFFGKHIQTVPYDGRHLPKIGEPVWVDTEARTYYIIEINLFNGSMIAQSLDEPGEVRL